MTFYFVMINAWSLAWEVLNGTMDEEYPIIDTSVGAGNTAYQEPIQYDFETPFSVKHLSFSEGSIEASV